MVERKPLPSIGVDKYTFFPLLTDTAAETTYGTAESLPGLVEIAPTDSGGTATFDADNGAYAALGYLEKPGHEITNADIPPEIDAKWRGLELDKGMLTVDGSVKDVCFGVAWRILKADGTYPLCQILQGHIRLCKLRCGQDKAIIGITGIPDIKSNVYGGIERLGRRHILNDRRGGSSGGRQGSDSGEAVYRYGLEADCVSVRRKAYAGINGRKGRSADILKAL